MAKNLGGDASAATDRKKTRTVSNRPSKRKTAPIDAVVLSWVPGAVAVVGGAFIPDLRPTPIRDGLCGIIQGRDLSYDFRGLEKDDRQRNAMFLDPAEDKFGYVEYDAKGRGYNTWSSPEEYAATVQGWVADGSIDAPDEEDTRAYIDARESLIVHTKASQTNTDRHVAALESDLAVAKAYLASLA